MFLILWKRSTKSDESFTSQLQPATDFVVLVKLDLSHVIVAASAVIETF